MIWSTDQSLDLLEQLSMARQGDTKYESTIASLYWIVIFWNKSEIMSVKFLPEKKNFHRTILSTLIFSRMLKNRF